MGDDIRPVAAGNGPASLPPGPAVHKDRRQRRPTGAPPPLPHPVTISTTAWLILGAVALAGAFLASQHTPWLRIDDRASTWVLRLLAGMRTPWLTDVANGINGAGSGWGATALGLSVVALTMAFRRWRHLLVFLGSVLFLEIAGTSIYFGLSRPRPYGVTIIGSWGGYSGISPPAAVLTIFLMGAVYCLAVPGRPRTYAKAAVAALVAVFCLARLYLAVDHVDDLLLGVALAVAIPVTAFRYFTPNEAFPVAYRRGRTAHVDVTGRRGQAIRQAVRDQLGLTVTEIKPVGLGFLLLFTAGPRLEGSRLTVGQPAPTPRPRLPAGSKSAGAILDSPSWMSPFQSARACSPTRGCCRCCSYIGVGCPAVHAGRLDIPKSPAASMLVTI